MPRSSLHLAAGVILAVASSAACSNSGVVSGAKDDHCSGVAAQPSTFFTCPTNGSDAGVDAEETVRYNAEADDDDCKYHVKWSATNVAKNSDVTFTVNLTWKADGSAVTGGAGKDVTYLEGFLSSMHPWPTTNYASKEVNPGEYTVGPVRFDEKGKWTVKFHFFGNCDDADDSKHGHVEFYVNVD